MANTECAIIGGGIIGLSLAWELAGRGVRVRLVDRQQVGRATSWAAAGMLPPADRATARDGYEQLSGLSWQRWPQFAGRLAEESGINPEFRRCGAIHLARPTGEALALASWQADLPENAVRIERLTPAELLEIEPSLAPLAENSTLRTILHLPEEAQVRPPRLLAALAEACRRRGVEITPDCEVLEFDVDEGRIIAALTKTERIAADTFCLAGGVWTATLAEQLGYRIGMEPFRGQMALFKCEAPPIGRMVNEGPRYLVPRVDGHVLVGSTMEEVGFDLSTTPGAIEGLAGFAGEILPELAGRAPVATWAGLRPAPVDGYPFLGNLPGLANGYIAAGHFRAGISLAPGTARVVAQLIAGEQSEIDLAPFRVGRSAGSRV